MNAHLTSLFLLIGILARLKIVVDRRVFDKKRERRERQRACI